MLLDSNILIYGAAGADPRLDAILVRADLAASIITRIETLGYHRVTQVHRQWFDLAFGRMRILALDDAVADRAVELRHARKTCCRGPAGRRSPCS